jgi:predicted class III extradiol MEMO1 family dioxygenase
MLLELALGNNLIIMSTQFQHKKIHKGTWLAPDQMTLNQIDYVLISSKKKELNEDVRSLTGTNIYSDHYLLKIIVNLNFQKYTLRRTKTALECGTNQISRIR